MKKIGKVALFGMITAMVVSFVRADEGCAAGSPGAAHPGRVLVLPCVTDEGGNIVIDNIGNFLSSFDVDSDGLLSAEEQKALFALVGDRSCAPCPPKPKAAPPRGGRQRVHACGACGCDPCRCAACDHKGPKGPRSKMKGCPCGPKCDCPQCDCGKGPRPGMKGCPWVKKHDHFPCPQGPPACDDDSACEGEVPVGDEVPTDGDEEVVPADEQAPADADVPAEEVPSDMETPADESTPVDDGASGSEEGPSDEEEPQEDGQKGE